MHKTFDTPGPISFYVELGSGEVKAQAGEVTETTVHVDGRDAEETVVEQRGNQVVVIAPKTRIGFFGTNGELTVTVTVPVGSELVTKLGSADLTATGCYGGARIKTGSGDVRVSELTGDAAIETGSGDVSVDTAGDDLRIKSGSGSVGVERATGSTVIATGSGDVHVGVTEADTAVKSGSGDVQVTDAHTDLAVSTASGDLRVYKFRVGALKAKGVSGDVLVGIPAGIPVWTDISTVSGSVRSSLEGAGQPDDGQPYVELRATTVSGDIVLQQL